MTRKLIIGVVLLIAIQDLKAQLKLEGDFRPRTEFRHGFGDIIADSSDAGYAIASRIRLNTSYSVDAYEFYLSIQDVFVWGENRQLNTGDSNNSFAVFEAWANIELGGGWSTKLGRQVLAYDDERIIGGADWALQGRNHDAVLMKYEEEKFQANLVFAFNQDFDNPGGFQSVGTAYQTAGSFSYKTMQSLYLKESWNEFSGSLLLLNNGFQNLKSDGTSGDGTSNLQTIGTHWEFQKGDFGTTLNAFIQTGERQNKVDVSGAYLLGLDLSYQVAPKVGLGLGTELISGVRGGEVGKTRAFFPLYGTNHKFNGLMDYFYLGNHANSVGLVDIHASVKLTLGEGSDLQIEVLNFNTEQKLTNTGSSLGTEIDLVFSKSFKGYAINFGYSQLFPTDAMYTLKGASENAAANSQYWAWAMLILKPEFLNTAMKP